MIWKCAQKSKLINVVYLRSLEVCLYIRHLYISLKAEEEEKIV